MLRIIVACYRLLPLLSVVVVVSSTSVAGCDSTLEVGTLTCSRLESAAADAGEVGGPVDLPWTTSFEHGFCDYAVADGFCYGDPRAEHEIVTSPVHSGRFAAAFSLMTDDVAARQSRCVRQGVLPASAYYGAWYFVPEPATNAALWNLFHFRGGGPGDAATQHGLWDVSLVNAENGSLEVIVYDFLSGRTRRPSTATPIPIRTWFHIEFYLKRAPDGSGAIALYQDGERVIEASNIPTDDSSWGQWYVGNLANGLTPSASTLYVDDVTIRGER